MPNLSQALLRSPLSRILKSSTQRRPGIAMPLNNSQIMDTTIHPNKWKSHRAVIEDEDEEDEEVEQQETNSKSWKSYNVGDNEAGSDNEDDPDLSLEEGSSNENWLITQ
ncbi:hypothetical protein EV426DRAFT_579152 [Tirmania nivea]|nr:hypothetical protein EV426DRAFT_579152 [Tirmania nivea]